MDVRAEIELYKNALRHLVPMHRDVADIVIGYVDDELMQHCIINIFETLDDFGHLIHIVWSLNFNQKLSSFVRIEIEAAIPLTHQRYEWRDSCIYINPNELINHIISNKIPLLLYNDILKYYGKVESDRWIPLIRRIVTDINRTYSLRIREITKQLT